MIIVSVDIIRGRQNLGGTYTTESVFEAMNFIQSYLDIRFSQISFNNDTVYFTNDILTTGAIITDDIQTMSSIKTEISNFLSSST